LDLGFFAAVTFLCHNILKHQVVAVIAIHAANLLYVNLPREVIMAYNDLYKSSKRRETMRRMFGFLIGVFVGWLVGSTLALLLAPASGEKLRGELRSRSTSFMGEIQSAAEVRRKQLEDQLAIMRAPRLPAKSE
jgi:hypothetical protein